MIKKISAILLSVVMAAAILTACGSTDSSAADSAASSADSAAADESSASDSEAEEQEIPVASMTVDGEAVDISDNPTILTIDGEEIKFDLFRYNYFSVAEILNTNYGITSEDIEADEELYKTFKSYLLQKFRNDYVARALAKEYDIELSDEDKAEIEQQLADFKANYESEEECEKSMAMNRLTDEVYIEMMTTYKLYEKVNDELFGENGRLVTSKEDFLEIAMNKDEYARVKHILIPYYCKAEITDEETKASYDDMSLYDKGNAKKAAYDALSDDEKEKVKEESKKLAEEVLKKAKDGEDFDKLIEEYGWDPGMEYSTDGYFMSHSSTFVEEFKDAGFGLDENEISDLTESESFGWFIIKRLPIEKEYIEENYTTLVSEYDQPMIDQITNDCYDKIEVVESDYFTKLSKYSDIT